MSEYDPMAQVPANTLADALEASYQEEIAALREQNAELRALVQGLGGDATMFAATTADLAARLSAIESMARALAEAVNAVRRIAEMGAK